MKDWFAYKAKWRVMLGPDEPLAPLVPTWQGISAQPRPQTRLETNSEIERICGQHHLDAEDIDALGDGFWWADRWDNFTGPQAKNGEAGHRPSVDRLRGDQHDGEGNSLTSRPKTIRAGTSSISFSFDATPRFDRLPANMTNPAELFDPVPRELQEELGEGKSPVSLSSREFRVLRSSAASGPKSRI